MKLKDILAKKFAETSANGVVLFFVPAWCDYGYDVKDRGVVNFLLDKFGEDDVRVNGRGIFGEER